MNTLKLYEITEQARALEKLAEDNDLSPDDIADTLEGIDLEFNDKAAQVGNFLMNLDPFEKGLDAEIKRLQAKKKALQNRRESVKDYLRRNMEEMGISKIECPVFTIRLKAAQPKVAIDEEGSLPDDYVNVKTSITPDKRAILKALKEGEDIPGARLETGTAPLEIK